MSRSTSWRAVQEAIVAASAADLLRAAIQLCSVAQLRALNQQPIAVAEGETHWLVQLQLLALPPAPLHGLPPPLPLPSESSAAAVCSAPSFAPAPMAAAAPRGALLQAAPEEFKQAAPPAPADAGVARGGAELSKEQPSLAGDAERGVEDKHQPAAAAAGGPLPRSVEGAATPRSVQRLTTRQLRRVLSSRGVPFPRAAAHAECVRLCEENGIRSVSDEELERADRPFAAAATTTGKRQAVEEGETRREGEATGGAVKDEQLARSPPQEETRGAAAGREGFGEEEEVGRAAREALEGPRVEEVGMEATLAVQPGEGLLESSPGGTREWIQGMTEESDPQGVEAAEEGESTREEVLDAANGDAAVREDGPPAGGAVSGGDEAGAGEEAVGGEAASETERAAGGEEVAPEEAFEGGDVAPLSKAARTLDFAEGAERQPAEDGGDYVAEEEEVIGRETAEESRTAADGKAAEGDEGFGGGEEAGRDALEESQTPAQSNSMRRDDGASKHESGSGEVAEGLGGGEEAGRDALEESQTPAEGNSIGGDDGATKIESGSGEAAEGLGGGEEAGRDALEESQTPAEGNSIGGDDGATKSEAGSGEAAEGLGGGEEAGRDAEEESQTPAEGGSIEGDDGATKSEAGSGEAAEGLGGGEEAGRDAEEESQTPAEGVSIEGDDGAPKKESRSGEDAEASHMAPDSANVEAGGDDISDGGQPAAEGIRVLGDGGGASDGSSADGTAAAEGGQLAAEAEPEEGDYGTDEEYAAGQIAEEGAQAAAGGKSAERDDESDGDGAEEDDSTEVYIADAMEESDAATGRLGEGDIIREDDAAKKGEFAEIVEAAQPVARREEVGEAASLLPVVGAETADGSGESHAEVREMANVDTNALDQVDSNPPGSPSEELYPDAEKYSESDGVRAAKLDEAEAEGEEKTDEEAVDQDGEVHALRDEAVLDAAAASAARGGESQLEGRHSPNGEYPAESRHDVPSPANADERRDGEGLHEDQSAGGETSAPVPPAAVQRARDELKVRKAEGKTAPLPTKTPAELRAFMKAQQAAAREQAELRGRHAAAGATRGVAGPPVAEESPRGGRKHAGGTPQASPPGASPSGAVSAAEDEGLCSGTISIVERRRLERGRKASPPDIFEQRASPIPLDDRPPWQDYWPRPMPKPNEECCVSRTCLANEIALRDRQTPPSGVRAAPVVFDPTVQPVSDSAPSSPAGLVSPTQQKIVQEPRGRFVGLSPKPSPEPCTPPSRGRIASMASLSDTSATPPMLSARDSLEWV